MAFLINKEIPGVQDRTLIIRGDILWLGCDQGFENNGNDAGVAVALPLPLPKKWQRQLDLSLP